MQQEPVTSTFKTKKVTEAVFEKKLFFKQSKKKSLKINICLGNWALLVEESGVGRDQIR